LRQEKGQRAPRHSERFGGRNARASRYGHRLRARCRGDPSRGAAPPGAPPADGKYERVVVDGVTVPMIQVMNAGAVILVDTDGKKPRSWEEQYKRKRALPNGQYDLHKTNTNGNDTFEDDAIDKEGLWVIDAKGNITKH
jgi:hypothetical protein